MKKLYLVLLGFSIYLNALGQTDSQFQTDYPDQINKILATNTKFPKESRGNIENGLVLLALKIDETGQMDSITILERGDDPLVLAVFDAIAVLKENWEPGFLENRDFNKSYLLSFYFQSEIVQQVPSGKFRPKDVPIQFLKKEKPEKALKSVMELISQNPYDPDLIAIRSEAYRQLGETEKSQKDYLQAKYLRKDMLGVVDIVAIGVPRSRTQINL
jgi:tetratricopeptide (TPR) repeat protein